MTDYQKLVDILMDETPEDSPWFGRVKDLVEKLIANGVTFATDNNVGSKWIPVTERLPEDDEVVLIMCKIGKMFVGYHKHLYPGYEFWQILTARDSTKKITYTVTHWMPLPEPPKGERV